MSKNYSSKLQDPRWQKKRLEILQKDNWKCVACGSGKKMLHVHHLEYTKVDPWDEPSENLETLCETCHKIKSLNINFKSFRDHVRKKYGVEFKKST